MIKPHVMNLIVNDITFYMYDLGRMSHFLKLEVK